MADLTKDEAQHRCYHCSCLTVASLTCGVKETGFHVGDGLRHRWLWHSCIKETPANRTSQEFRGPVLSFQFFTFSADIRRVKFLSRIWASFRIYEFDQPFRQPAQSIERRKYGWKYIRTYEADFFLASKWFRVGGFSPLLKVLDHMYILISNRIYSLMKHQALSF